MADFLPDMEPWGCRIGNLRAQQSRAYIAICDIPQAISSLESCERTIPESLASEPAPLFYIEPFCCDESKHVLKWHPHAAQPAVFVTILLHIRLEHNARMAALRTDSKPRRLRTVAFVSEHHTARRAHVLYGLGWNICRRHRDLVDKSQGHVHADMFL